MGSCDLEMTVDSTVTSIFTVSGQSWFCLSEMKSLKSPLSGLPWTFCIAQAGTDLTRSSCLRLTSTGISGICHHTARQLYLKNLIIKKQIYLSLSWDFPNVFLLWWGERGATSRHPANNPPPSYFSHRHFFAQVFLQKSFKILLKFLWWRSCFAYMYVCEPQECLEPIEVRRGHWVLWNYSYGWLWASI